jgi:hypothetical protein
LPARSARSVGSDRRPASPRLVALAASLALAFAVAVPFALPALANADSVLTPGETVRVDVNAAGEQPELGLSRTPSLSGDGRFVAFASPDKDLVAGDTNGSPTSSCATCSPGSPNA